MVSSLLFLILSLLCFSSVIVGVLLSYFVKEELTHGKKYFKVFQDWTIIVTVIVFLYFNQSILFFILIPVLFVSLRYVSKYQYDLYFGLSVLLFFSYFYSGFEYVWVLVFLYGFLMSSYFCSCNQKLKKKDAILILIKNNWSYLLGSLIGFLLLMFF